ncbi:unnamed protein product [Trichogramma brassicae]|uniref:Odorant receptor n=1 Tax=Trichogramma brassicae TaxID=86971 RepID=A0A6H5IK30_9HYME|nr:unnamed protein product [Trichogramma brassicae]
MPVAAVQTFSANLEVTQDSLDINGSSGVANEKKLRILTFPTYEAWINLDDEIVYQFVYLMQCLSGYVMDTITVGTCSLAAVFVTHTCAQLELVVEMSRNYVDSRKNDKTPKTSTERLTVLVKKHCRALKFCLHEYRLVRITWKRSCRPFNDHSSISKACQVDGRELRRFDTDHVFQLYMVSSVIIFNFGVFMPRALDLIMPLNESRPLHQVRALRYYIDALDDSFYFVLFHGMFFDMVSIVVIVGFDTLLINCAQHACALFKIASTEISDCTEEINQSNERVNLLTRRSMQKNIYHRKIVKAAIIHKHALEIQLRHPDESLFLKPIGIWPVGEGASSLVKMLRDANVVACFWLICFLLVPCALHTFLEEPNPNIKLKLIGPMSFCLMALAKYCSLVGYIPEIAACFEHVEQDWTMYRRTNSQYELCTMRRNAKIGRKLALLCAAFMYGGGFFYHTIMPLSSGKIATTEFTQRLLDLLSENNTDLEHMGHGPRALTYPIYARLLNVERSPVYEIVFAVQTVSGFVLYTITIGACSLAATFVVHVCAQLQIVMDLLGNLADGMIEGGSGLEVDVEARLNDKIATIVERHLRALTACAWARRLIASIGTSCRAKSSRIDSDTGGVESLPGEDHRGIQGHRVHTVPGLNFNVYSATKHAVTAITETLQKELLGGKIRVTSISPGVVKSEIFEETNVDESEYSHYPTLNSSDVAEAVAFIVSRPQHVQITEMTIRPLGELI